MRIISKQCIFNDSFQIFFIALQTQQMWSQENNVTFISAGANMPLVGSGGTGIFVGEYGIKKFQMY